jgi:hypothetical protein
MRLWPSEGHFEEAEDEMQTKTWRGDGKRKIAFCCRIGQNWIENNKKTY